MNNILEETKDINNLNDKVKFYPVDRAANVVACPRGLDEFLATYVFCLKKKRIVNRYTLELFPVSTIMDYHQQDFTLSPIDDPISLITKKEREIVEKRELTYNLWQSHEKRLRVYDTIYRPDFAFEFVEIKGNLYYNLAVMPHHAVVDFQDVEVKSAIEKFHHALECVIGHGFASSWKSHPNCKRPRKVDWFLHWLALNIQQPHIRCVSTPVYVSEMERGFGNRWLSDLLCRLLGEHNVSQLAIDDIQASTFKKYVPDKTLCILNTDKDLVSTDSDKKNAKAVLKNVNDNQLPIMLQPELKYKNNIYTNLLVLEHIDNVYRVADFREIKMEILTWNGSQSDERTNLFSLLEDNTFIRVVFHYLAKLDLSDFNESNGKDKID